MKKNFKWLIALATIGIILLGSSPVMPKLVSPPKLRIHTWEISEIGRANEIRIENVSVGVLGIRVSGEGIYLSGYEIFVEELIIDGLSAPNLYIGTDVAGSVGIHELVIKDVIADGHGIHEMSRSVGKVIVGDYGTLESKVLTNADVREIDIDDATGPGYVKSLIIRNVNCQGSVLLNRMAVGKLEIINSKIGDGDGINISDLVIGSPDSKVYLQSKSVSISVKSLNVR